MLQNNFLETSNYDNPNIPEICNSSNPVNNSV